MAAPDTSSGPLSGTTLGRFRVGALLGRGGMGVSHHIAEIVNRPPDPRRRTWARRRSPTRPGCTCRPSPAAKDAYEHVDPEAVGNGTRFVVSEMAGRATITLKANELGLDIDGAALSQVIDELKRLEHEGYHFEAADALPRAAHAPGARLGAGLLQLESYPGDRRRAARTAAPRHRGDREAARRRRAGRCAIGEGNGPVNALDAALRAAIGDALPAARRRSTSPTSRSASSTRRKGTGAVTRVLIDSTDGERTWSTIGVSENIIQAAWQALEDSPRLRPPPHRT